MSELPRIELLPIQVINNIAAGEAITQPANIVKELLENSIDAGSTRIQIQIVNGGFNLIKITDNGTGISPQDFTLVCRRHTTSKIRQFSDLTKISTFGFRGEALFSMSCVSHLRITTKTASDAAALTAMFSNGEIDGQSTHTAGNTGTTVEVRDFFYNRLDRLASVPDAPSNTRLIIQTATFYSYAYPNISFSITCDQKERLRTYGHSISQDVISLVTKSDSNATIHISGELPHHSSFDLYITNPNQASTLKGAGILINGRLVQCERAKRGIYDMYKEFHSTKKPFILCLLSIPTNYVDINVHPTKKDVNIRNDDEIISALCQIARDKILDETGNRKFKSERPTTKNLSIEAFIAANPPPPAKEEPSCFPTEKEHALNHNSEDLPISSNHNSDVHISNNNSEDLPISSNHNSDELISNLNESISNDNTQGSSSSEDDSIEEEVCYTKPKRVSPSAPSSPYFKSKPQINLKKRGIDLFSELRYEPKSKYARSDPTVQTLEQVISLPVTKSTARVQRTDLESIKELRLEIEAKKDQMMSTIFRRHSFVGTVDLTYVVFSYDEQLFIARLFELTRVFFYQLFVRHVGGFGVINLEPGVDIARVVEAAGGDSKAVLEVFEKHGEFLKDYFMIEERDGVLVSLPICLPGYAPSFGALPIFLSRLALVPWKAELQCVKTLIDELSMFYAIQPNDIVDPDNAEIVKKTIENVIFPEMRTDAFSPPESLITNGTITLLRSVSEMYHIFERN